MTPRPKRLGAEVWAKAEPKVRELVKKLPCMEGADDHDLGKAYRAIVTAYDFDGFKLAKKLEEDLLCDCCFEDAEELSAMDGILHYAHEQSVRDWVKAESLTVPFQFGDKVTFKHGDKKMAGIVGRIDAEMARLIVTVEGKSGCPVVNFEDAEKSQ